MTTPGPLHVAAALTGAGWHPAAWRAGSAHAAGLFTPDYWLGLVREAERAGLTLVTLEDALAPAGPHEGDGGRDDRPVGQLDAELLAARLGPATTHLGLVPTVVAPLTEPFHLSKAVATLDYVSTGRAGVRVRTSLDPEEYANVGRRPAPGSVHGDADPELVDRLFDEVADYVEVLRRLWDSWEDDAEIRDPVTGRFVDVDRLHYIDFEGEHFHVRGPSITPRPPQGQPPVALLAHGERGLDLLARSGDIGLVTPDDADEAAVAVHAAQRAAERIARDPEELRLFGDLVVFLDADAGTARRRKERLDALAGAELASDATVFVGTPAELAERLAAWSEAGLDGIRLRPGQLPHDLEQITRGLVPLLREQALVRPGYTATTLRGELGLSRPVNRYAHV